MRTTLNIVVILVYIDLHLLACVSLNAGTQLWTRDKRLRKVAEPLGLAFPELDA